MRKPAICILVAAAALACASCRQEIAASSGLVVPPTVTETPPVKVGRPAEKPMPPVDEAPAETANSQGQQKSDWLASLPEIPDNPLAGCEQCHVDVEKDYVGGTHYKEKVGCTNCHGASKGHLADENNEVKPDELFARQDVDRLCGKCHECFRDEGADPPGTDNVCTDCHGSHKNVIP